METVTCPYCKQKNHTSSPRAMAECAYCGKRFAQAKSDYQTLVIIDNQLDSPWQVAEDLMEEWRERGELEKEAVVDRRLGAETHAGRERRGAFQRMRDRPRLSPGRPPRFPPWRAHRFSPRQPGNS